MFLFLENEPIYLKEDEELHICLQKMLKVFLLISKFFEEKLNVREKFGILCSKVMTNLTLSQKKKFRKNFY